VRLRYLALEDRELPERLFHRRFILLGYEVDQSHPRAEGVRMTRQPNELLVRRHDHVLAIERGGGDRQPLERNTDKR